MGIQALQGPEIFALVLLYWIVVVAGWVLAQRIKSRRREPAVIRELPDGNVEVGLHASLDARWAGAVLLLPPLLLLILKVAA